MVNSQCSIKDCREAHPVVCDLKVGFVTPEEGMLFLGQRSECLCSDFFYAAGALENTPALEFTFDSSSNRFEKHKPHEPTIDESLWDEPNKS